MSIPNEHVDITEMNIVTTSLCFCRQRNIVYGHNFELNNGL